MTADELLARLLDVKGKGPSWTARCPAHEDKTPSLSVTASADRMLLKCHAGCSVAAVVGALELKLADLFFYPPSGNGRKWTQEDADRALSQRGLRREVIEHFRVVADLEKQAWAFPLGAGRPTKYKAFQAVNGPKYWSEKGATLGCWSMAGG